MSISPDQRHNPDTLGAHVQGGERENERGKLKIFLGYIAGVGKTYEMLNADSSLQELGGRCRRRSCRDA